MISRYKINRSDIVMEIFFYFFGFMLHGYCFIVAA